MTLSPSEMLTLAGLMRFVTRFDDLDADARRAALDEASRELDLRASDVQVVESQRAGFRDAAMIVRVVSTELDDWMERARREIADDHQLRSLVERSVSSPAARVSMLRAVEILARHGGLTPKERFFLDWLTSEWGMAPVTDD